jgi:hypothetical protein
MGHEFVQNFDCLGIIIIIIIIMWINIPLIFVRFQSFVSCL